MHGKTISEGLGCLNWVAVAPPAGLPKDIAESAVGGSDYWANKIRVTYKKNGPAEQVCRKYCSLYESLETGMTHAVLLNGTCSKHQSSTQWPRCKPHLCCQCCALLKYRKKVFMLHTCTNTARVTLVVVCTLHCTAHTTVNQVEFCDTFKGLLTGLVEYIVSYHKTGVDWYMRGGDVSAYTTASSSGSSAPAGQC
jgi:hypothetical protein